MSDEAKHFCLSPLFLLGFYCYNFLSPNNDSIFFLTILGSLVFHFTLSWGEFPFVISFPPLLCYSSICVMSIPVILSTASEIFKVSLCGSTVSRTPKESSTLNGYASISPLTGWWEQTLNWFHSHKIKSNKMSY